jgi:hypothetical protein
MNGEKMTTEKTSKRVSAKAKLAALQADYDKLQADHDELKESVGRLKAVNAEQLTRLVDQTLLEGRMRELQKLIAKKDDE